MELKHIKALYKFLNTTDIVELEIEDERGRVRLKRQGAAGQEVEARAASSVPPPREAAEPASEAGVEKIPSNWKVVPSPMVGIFYRFPAPETPPFVEMGSQVNSGQVVCIIEAMKIMNEVESDVAGKVVAILVENGQPVEYGEPLFHIEV